MHAEQQAPYFNMSPKNDRHPDFKTPSALSTGLSPSLRNQHSALSDRIEASKIGRSQGGTSVTARKLKKVKTRKVDLTEENALVLINELYGQKGKSYARPGDIKVTNSRNLLQRGLDE